MEPDLQRLIEVSLPPADGSEESAPVIDVLHQAAALIQFGDERDQVLN